MSSQNNTKAKKQIKPTSNTIQISSKRDTGFYVFLSKLFLMDFNDIELHALGDAITIAVKVGELLCRYGYVDIESIQTTTITPESGSEGTDKQDDKGRRGKKAKLIVKLKKSANFPKLIENFRIQKN
jgi:Alba